MKRFSAWISDHAVDVVFTAALLVASIGFGLAWLPLGLIFPGVLIVGVMIAQRWRTAFPPRSRPEPPPTRLERLEPME